MEHIIEHGDYMPHGMCLLWQPWLVILWAGSDLLIFLSYTAIPIALLTVLHRREDVPHAGLVTLFASFILLCGLTHLFGIVTLWYPIYPLVGWVKLATGLVSMTTAVVLFRLIPTLVELPSPATLNAANEKLKQEIAAHRQTLSSLEKTVEERTGELQVANRALAVQTREAVHRSRNLLSVVSSLAVQTAKGSPQTKDFLDTFLGRIKALADATKSIENDGKAAADLGSIIAHSLSPIEDAYGPRISHDGPPLTINQEAAQQIGLALHELATNTQKYGLGVAESVKVQVTWTINADSFELLWRERGLPDDGVDENAIDEGFGTQLLTRVVPAMLRGRAERTLERDGLTYRLTAPLAAVEADEKRGQADQLAARIIDEGFGLNEAAEATSS